MVSQEEIFTKVQAALVDALALDEEDVTPQATLQGDLGAESIDYLDIMFKLEKAFGIKIQREELFPEDILTNAQYVQSGKLTSEGVAKLKERLPYVDLSRFEQNPSVQSFGSMLTVQDMVRYVENKLALASS
jgi:acyl carrier protein